MPKAWHGDFAACGQRSGLLALNLANIFEKLLDQKTFVCLRLVIENTFLRENGLSHPAKGGSTPAFACQYAAIAPLPCLNLQLISQGVANSELAGFKKCNCSRKNRLQNQFASQMWAARPEPRQHF
ncbi:MAG: hypothetical protein MR378_01970 [Ruminococcus sp.]|nr:hypothetical protein [Ruminococcus sp.]